MTIPTPRKEFSNKSNNASLSIKKLATHLLKLTGNWPKVISGQLCAPDGDGVMPLPDPPCLFAYIDRFAEVKWRRGGVPKAEFFAGLPHNCERYEWASPHPHFPPLPGVYYTTKPPLPANTGKLDELVARFSPATEYDRLLIKAMVLTFFWGGPKGKRPVFAITTDGGDAKKGRGAGKTTLAEVLAGLVGGVIGLQVRASTDRTRAVLLSPAAWGRRVVLIDNLKSYRFSSDEFEGLVTCEEITGHRLHHGFAARPNYLTYVVTVNGASFSKDMAERSVVVKVKQPTTSPTWYADTRALITEHWDEIVADVRWHLVKKPGMKLNGTDRWPDWCRGVLSKTDKPNAALKLTEQRRRAIDADDGDEEDVVDHVRTRIAAACESVDRVVWVPVLLMAKWVMELRRDFTQHQASQFLRAMVPRVFQYHRHSAGTRYYVWRGKEAEPSTPPITLSYEVNNAAH